MTDPRQPAGSDAEIRSGALRRLGALAHQLRATMRAADHFIARGGSEDRDTGAWLVSSAVELAIEVTGEIDSLARALRDASADTAFAAQLARLRVLAHQLHATARAADHFLEQESADDRETGSWLIAGARGLTERLAGGLDDASGNPRRAPTETVVDANEAALQRRVSQAARPVRGVA